MLSLAILPILINSKSPTQSPQTVKISVNSKNTLNTMTEAHLGVGVAVWDAHMLDSVIPNLVKDAGFKIIRYPGGSYADLYHWKTAKATKGMQATIQPKSDFDNFMKLSVRSNTTPLITVNYGSNPEGTGPAEPAEAAEWVQYANKKNKWNVKYWEIGNEIYGNGFYNGSGWEVDLNIPETVQGNNRRGHPLLGPSNYGKRVKQFAQAMKKVDSTIKVGAVISEGGWPANVEPDWTSNTLKQCGDVVDFVVIHWYGSGKTPTEMYRSLDSINKIVKDTRAKIERVVGPARSKKITIWMTEGDSGNFGMQYEGGLFAVDHLFEWWEAGTEHINWWNLHNGMGKNPMGQPDDQGILSSGHTAGGFSQPAPNTPFATYWGLKLVGQSVSPGDRLLETSGATQTCTSHTWIKKNGTLGISIVNRDPKNPQTIEVNLDGFKISTNGKATTLLEKPKVGLTTKTVKRIGKTLKFRAEPNSANVIMFPKA
jgi:alpha-L-arabinofuranosidase